MHIGYILLIANWSDVQWQAKFSTYIEMGLLKVEHKKVRSGCTRCKQRRIKVRLLITISKPLGLLLSRKDLTPLWYHSVMNPNHPATTAKNMGQRAASPYPSSPPTQAKVAYLAHLMELSSRCVTWSFYTTGHCTHHNPSDPTVNSSWRCRRWCRVLRSLNPFSCMYVYSRVHI